MITGERGEICLKFEMSVPHPSSFLHSLISQLSGNTHQPIIFQVWQGHASPTNPSAVVVPGGNLSQKEEDGAAPIVVVDKGQMCGACFP